MEIVKENKQTNFSKNFFVALTCVFIGGFIGIITNIINLIVSPTYFMNILNWGEESIWFFGILQGAFEGIIYGIIFSLIFTIAFQIITKGKATYKFALNQLLKIIILIFICWIIGGILALTLASINPEFYQSHFYAVPKEKIEMLKYAWVGGSIWGEMFGGLLSVVFGILLIKNNWKINKKPKG